MMNTQPHKVILYAVLAVLVGGQSSTAETLEIKKNLFGQAEGHDVFMYTLQNEEGLIAQIMNYGAILFSFSTPDRNGLVEDITLGYSTLEEFVVNRNYFGATIGRYANRIAKGRFTLDGVDYRLAQNNNDNHLHGGLKGFNKVIWASEAFMNESAVGVILTYHSKDGEEGYPGNLSCTVVYTLTNHNELKIDYTAQTDSATPVNMTHHTFWNLSGNFKRNILGHELRIDADFYLPVDEYLIPTGEISSVKDSLKDFTASKTIGSRIDQVKGGYDHNYVLNRASGDFMKTPAAVLYDPQSGRKMEVFTTQPGIQFYSGNFLDGSITGKNNVQYEKYFALCLETQHFPDSPNRPYFPNTILRPDQEYNHLCVYRFSTR